jgi:hypothetical protein
LITASIKRVYPIPHQLNLSYFVQAVGPLLGSALPPGGSFIAAPTFVANNISYEPKLSGITTDSSANVVSISYSSSNTATSDFTIVAKVKPLLTTDCGFNNRTTRTPPILLKDPFVALPLPEDTAWQHQLIPLAAELFDPAARLIGALRQVMIDWDNQQPTASTALKSALGSKLENLDSYSACAVNTMQSVADCGGQHSPGTLMSTGKQGGPSLLTRILRVWIDEQPALNQTKALNFQTSLLGAFDSYPPLAYGDWINRLQLVPALAGNSLVTPPKVAPTSTKLSEVLFARLSALESLHLALTQNDTLGSIVDLQWKKFYESGKTLLTQADPDGSLWQSFSQTAEEQLKKIDLRQQLAAGNLGSNWSNVLSEMAKAVGTVPTSRAALRTGLSNALCMQLTKALAAPPNATAFDPSSLLTCLFAKTNCSAAATGPSWVDDQLNMIVQDAPVADANH